MDDYKNDEVSMRNIQTYSEGSLMECNMIQTRVFTVGWTEAETPS